MATSFPPQHIRHVQTHANRLAHTAALSPLQLLQLHEAARVLAFSSTIVELTNEGMDVLFLGSLYSLNDKTLFNLSLSCLLITLLTRCAIILSFARRMRHGGCGQFVVAAAVYVVEPNAGLSMIEPLLMTETAEKFLDERAILTHEVDRMTTIATLKSVITMILLEDLPELLIEGAYLYQANSTGPADPIFLMSTMTTLVHLMSGLYEVWVLLCFLPLNTVIRGGNVLSVKLVIRPTSLAPPST